MANRPKIKFVVQHVTRTARPATRAQVERIFNRVLDRTIRPTMNKLAAYKLRLLVERAAKLKLDRLIAEGQYVPSKRQRANVTIYRAKDGFRWRAKTRNGRIVAESGEAYTRRGGANRAVTTLKGLDFITPPEKKAKKR